MPRAGAVKQLQQEAPSQIAFDQWGSAHFPPPASTIGAPFRVVRATTNLDPYPAPWPALLFQGSTTRGITNRSSPAFIKSSNTAESPLSLTEPP